jgi:hypothetical protein
MCLIESAGLFENAFTNEHACSRNRGIILLQPGAVEIPGMPAWNTMVGNTCDATQTYNHASVL